MHNSLSKVFDGLNIKGCLFHSSQSCWRKICELGCRNQYNTDDEFKLLMKSFCALAFLKTDEVISAFEQLADNDNVPSAFIPYFDCTYIGIVRGWGGRQRRDVPIAL